MFNAAHLMSTELFVGGDHLGTNDDSLRAFASFGDVTEGRESRKSTGFGFVNFVNGDEAKSAMEAMDKRNIRMNFANERPPGNQGGGGCGGDGYGNQ
uniref:RRM domain-containing protein n=1 Tax=Oryza brachyantha TaxID=4533 RepID=J3N1V6_ORYBR